MSELRSHLTMGGAIIGNKLVDTGDRALENALIGRSFGTGYLGSFSLAYQISRFFCDAIINPLWLTLYVQALRLEDDGRFRTYGKFSRMAAMILFPAATLGAAEANALIGHLLGSNWLAMSPLFQLLLLTYAFSVAGSLGGAVLYSKGQAAIQLRITAEATVIRLVSVVLAPWVGIWILWLGLPAANLYAGARSTVATCHSVHQSPVTLIKPLLLPGASAIGVGLICWGAATLMESNLFVVVLELIGSFSLYLILLFLLVREQITSDMTDILRIVTGSAER